MMRVRASRSIRFSRNLKVHAALSDQTVSARPVGRTGFPLCRDMSSAIMSVRDNRMNRPDHCAPYWRRYSCFNISLNPVTRSSSRR